MAKVLPIDKMHRYRFWSGGSFNDFKTCTPLVLEFTDECCPSFIDTSQRISSFSNVTSDSRKSIAVTSKGDGVSGCVHEVGAFDKRRDY